MPNYDCVKFSTIFQCLDPYISEKDKGNLREIHENIMSKGTTLKNKGKTSIKFQGTFFSLRKPDICFS